MSYKALLLSLLSIASYNAYSMEAIVEPEAVQAVVRCEQKLDHILYCLSNQVYFLGGIVNSEFCRAIKLLVKSILKHLQTESEFADFYHFLNETHNKIMNIDNLKLRLKTCLLSIHPMVVDKMMHITNRNLPLNSNQKSALGILKKLAPVFIEKLIDLRLNLFDEWLIYVRENKFKDFENDVINNNAWILEHIILSFANHATINSLIELLEKRFSDVAEYKLINKTYGKHQIPLLAFLSQQAISDIEINLSTRELIIKFVNNPNTSTSVLNATDALINLSINRTHERDAFESIISQTLRLISVDYLTIINFRLNKIKILKEKLFEAVQNQDTDLTRKRAFELYSITQDFQNAKGDTPMHLAVLMKNKELIQALLSVYPGLIDIENNDGRTPVSLAAGDPEMLKIIFEIANRCLYYDDNKDKNDILRLMVGLQTCNIV